MAAFTCLSHEDIVSKQINFLLFSLAVLFAGPQIAAGQFQLLYIKNNLYSRKHNIWQPNLDGCFRATASAFLQSRKCVFSPNSVLRWSPVEAPSPSQQWSQFWWSPVWNGNTQLPKVGFLQGWFFKHHRDTDQWPHSKRCPRKIKITTLVLWWVSQILYLTLHLIMLGKKIIMSHCLQGAQYSSIWVMSQQHCVV